MTIRATYTACCDFCGTEQPVEHPDSLSGGWRKFAGVPSAAAPSVEVCGTCMAAVTLARYAEVLDRRAVGTLLP